MSITPAIYAGTVTHRRLRPVVHDLSYSVASLFVDVDQLARGETPAEVEAALRQAHGRLRFAIDPLLTVL